MTTPVPLATIFGGNVTLEKGSDPSLFGWGDLTVARNVVISGTENSTGAESVGTLLVAGGSLFQKDMYIGTYINNADLYALFGHSHLSKTSIETDRGNFTVTGANGIGMEVGGNIVLHSTDGNLDILTSNNGSIITLDSTNNGNIHIYGNTIECVSSHGNINIETFGGNGEFIVNSTSASSNLSISLRGSVLDNWATPASLNIESDGALQIKTLHTDAEILIANSNIRDISGSTGLGNGKISLLAGAGGLDIISNTGGVISLLSQSASTMIKVDSDGNSGQDLLISLSGVLGSGTNSNLKIESDGNIKVYTKTNNKDIQIYQNENSIGMISITAGSGGLDVRTQQGGSINMTALNAGSVYENIANAPEQDLIFKLTGNTESNIIIESSGKIICDSTNGTILTSLSDISLISNTSIRIANDQINYPGVPVEIGTSTSITTIHGDLVVKGVTTTVDSETVTVKDNIMLVNSGPSGISDGGIAIKRYQPAADNSIGAVVTSTDDVITGTFEISGNTSTQVNLGITSSTQSNIYNGWWIKITSGKGAGQVRKIKEYNGNTQIATIYSTADQIGILGNPQPVEGKDFITIPDNMSTYSLYSCHYVMMIWDETQDEFSFICTPNNPTNNVTDVSISHYAPIRVGTLNSTSVNTGFINETIADTSLTVTLQHSVVSNGSKLVDFPKNYGIYILIVKPLTSDIKTHAIFMIGRINDEVPGTVTRLMSIKGKANEQLDMRWLASGGNSAEYLPEIFYRTTPDNSIYVYPDSSTTFKIKIITV